MAGQFDGQVVVVTGASAGNGRAIALKFALAGASVACSDIREEITSPGYDDSPHLTTTELIRSRGGKAMFVHANVASPDAMSNLIGAAVLEFGRLDVMVNNAGIGWLKSIVDETPEELELVWSVNGRGVYLGCKYAITQMLTQEPRQGSRGRIVNVSSIGGLAGLSNEPSYCMTKGAVIQLTKALALDFAQERININAICPGFIYTAMTRPYMEDPIFRNAVHALTPWPEIGRAEDVANATMFLSSEESRWMTGSILALDGGFTAG